MKIGLVLALAALNGALSAVMLPLWEGWDEPFHYGYVQYVATEGRLPVLGRTWVSREVMRSLELAPASGPVQKNLPQVRTFAEFSRLPAERQRALRGELAALDPGLRRAAGEGTNNYEAQQAPLAYVLMAVLEFCLGGFSLVTRVLVLRLLVVWAAIGLQFWFMKRLGEELGVARGRVAVGLFLVFACQMFYAAVGHVANDWLAVPLATGVLWAGCRYWRLGGRREAAALGALVAAGLLTKAYFLAFAVFGVGLVVVRRRGGLGILTMGLAAPWYVRNWLETGSISGMQQAAAGYEAARVWDYPWGAAVLSAARGAVWTGNGSFTSFSRGTVDLLLICLLVGLVYWAKGRKRASEWVVWGGLLVFVGALQYAGLLFYAQAGQVVATPWYYQALAGGLVLLAVARTPRWGLGGAVLVSTWLLVATYWVKLLPMYGAGEEGRMTVGRLWAFYTEAGWGDGMYLGPKGVVLVLAGVTSVMAPVVGWAVLRQEPGGDDLGGGGGAADGTGAE